MSVAVEGLEFRVEGSRRHGWAFAQAQAGIVREEPRVHLSTKMVFPEA